MSAPSGIKIVHRRMHLLARAGGESHDHPGTPYRMTVSDNLMQPRSIHLQVISVSPLSPPHSSRLGNSSGLGLTGHAAALAIALIEWLVCIPALLAAGYVAVHGGARGRLGTPVMVSPSFQASVRASGGAPQPCAQQFLPSTASVCLFLSLLMSFKGVSSLSRRLTWPPLALCLCHDIRQCIVFPSGCFVPRLLSSLTNRRCDRNFQPCLVRRSPSTASRHGA